MFSTPPAPTDMVMSSTPLKQKLPRVLTPTGKPTRGGPKTSTPAKNPAKDKANKSVSLSTPTAIRKRTTKQTKNSRAHKKENLWDECLKKNPELAQFVDQFNQSLEEATSKPLDMS